MTKSLTYLPPIGEILYDTNTSAILHEIETHKEPYFTTGDLFGYVEVAEVNKPAHMRISICFSDSHGYYVELFRAGKDRDHDETFNPVSAPTRTDVTRVCIGQSTLVLPAEFFIDKDQLLSVVRHFCDSEEMDPTIDWLSHSETDWKFYDPEEFD
jgi:hypothetical protein